MKALHGDTVALPAPTRQGGMPLADALAKRRSAREFAPAPLGADQIGQLLWAAQGVTSRAGQRTAPSAGALYPLELYVATADGLFHYEPAAHRLTRRAERDPRAAIAAAAHGQESVAAAPAVFAFAAVAARTEGKYGTRTPRYVAMEAGHAAQNLLLEATALGLVGVPVGAFDDRRLAEALGLPPDQQPLYLVPVGRPR
jgi:SagB-type dehydrogenase family enzyme